MNELDKALADFLDDEQCETTSEAIYQLIRAAFMAGWEAAMGSDIGKVMKVEGGGGGRQGKVPGQPVRPAGAVCGPGHGAVFGYGRQHK